MKKSQKNVTSRKLQRFEQSYLKANFAILESTLTRPNYSVGNFRFLKNNHNLRFLKIFEKITKNVISQKLQRFEQSYLKANFAILESTLTRPNYSVGNFRFLKNNHNLRFLKIFEKITKNVISQKLQRFEQSYLKTNFAILESTLTRPNYSVGNFRFLKNNHNLSFLKIFEKITEKVISRKLQRIKQSFLEARFAILDSVL